MISAIVLAAGVSRRMGKTKQLLEWEGKALLRHVLENIRPSGVEELILVLGYQAEKIEEAMDTGGMKVVLNRNYQDGMITSIREGVKNLDETAEAFFIVLADQPGVKPEVYDRMIRAYRAAAPPKNIVLPTYCGRRGHPALFSAKYKTEAFRMEGDIGFRRVVQEHPEDILEVEMETDSVLQDIDTPEDYRKHCRNKPEGSP